ncbi:hypothetical protein UFOVP238_29 [uncultured Caudovirales phage]|uniref:Uncharacterized protein n=1 Tax=uncultured Caudovirales phage TaxID=2100421 RepID=A0A6J7WQQ0_9CAUD|nr:hypothetical protein UFOVP238_29 [uncultured Caudovirales phage]
MTKKQQEKIQEALLELADLKTQQDEIAWAVADAESRLITLMDSAGEKTVTTDDDGVKGTLVRASSLVINEDGLRKAVGAKLWNRITKRTLDKKKLEAFVTTGEISAVLVAAHSSERQSKPYVRLTPSRTTKENLQ